jgi:hypothetical protein
MSGSGLKARSPVSRPWAYDATSKASPEKDGDFSEGSEGSECSAIAPRAITAKEFLEAASANVSEQLERPEMADDSSFDDYAFDSDGFESVGSL